MDFNQYNKLFKKDLEEGNKYQDFITQKMWQIGLPVISFHSKNKQISVGESINGIEVKFDRKLKETGNIYIETHCIDFKTINEEFPIYNESGIFRPDNTWLWIIGDYEKVFLFAKKHLQNYYINNLNKLRKTVTKNSNIVISKGFLMDKKLRNKYSIMELDYE